MQDFGTLEPIKEKIKLDGKIWIVTEASEASAVAFQNSNTKAARYDPETGKRVSLDGIYDGEPILVGMNLYEADQKSQDFLYWNEKKDPVPVGVDVVLAWKASIVEPLYEKIKSMSPTLSGKETIESLEEQIEREQKLIAGLIVRRDKLKKDKEKGVDPTIATGGIST